VENWEGRADQGGHVNAGAILGVAWDVASRYTGHIHEDAAMVMLYVRGKPIGPLTDVKLLTELVESGQAVEFRDGEGKNLGRFSPEPIIPWEPDVTQEEVERRASEPGFTFDEVKKRLGWQ
jgi:hypothetical protein